MKKLLIALALLMCLTLPALAEWMDQYDWPDWAYEIEYPVVVTDQLLCQELETFARAELTRRFPGLTEAQLANFVVDDVYTYESKENWWSVCLHYDGCESVMMEFDIIRTAEGALEVEWVLPWDIEALVNLCDSSISYEEALAVGRISLGAAMAAYAAEFPERAQAAVDRCGLAMLDPAGFVVEADFISPLNGGLDDEPAHWSISFALPVDPAAGDDWNVNPLWYQVDVNAATGAVMDETTFRLFSVYQLED